MPELADRKKWEQALQRAFREIGRRRWEMLLKAMGTPPNPDHVPDSFWRSLGRDLRERFEPILKDIYLAGAQGVAGQTPIKISWDLANENAAKWVTAYSFKLVRKINATTQERLQTLIGGFFREKGMTVGDLRKLIAPEVDDLVVWMRDGTQRVMTSAERAKLIATTEVTRASVEGEKGIVHQIAEAGIEMVAIWETQRDAKVCEICRPRQGKARGDGWQDDPPAHPGCYCNLRYEPKRLTS